MGIFHLPRRSFPVLAPLILDSSQRLIRAPQGVEGVTHLQKTNSCTLCKEVHYTKKKYQPMEIHNSQVD